MVGFALHFQHMVGGTEEDHENLSVLNRAPAQTPILFRHLRKLPLLYVLSAKRAETDRFHAQFKCYTAKSVLMLNKGRLPIERT